MIHNSSVNVNYVYTNQSFVTFPDDEGSLYMHKPITATKMTKLNRSKSVEMVFLSIEQVWNIDSTYGVNEQCEKVSQK